jgi:hypothetical protein
MRYLKYVALLAILMVPFAYSQAQVRVASVRVMWLGRRLAPTGITTTIPTPVRRTAITAQTIS